MPQGRIAGPVLNAHEKNCFVIKCVIVVEFYAKIENYC